MRALLRAVLHLRLLRLAGWTCFTLALLTHVSDRHRPVVGRWSVEATATIALALLVWLVLAFRRSNGGARTSAVLFDAGLLCWGVAYLWAALAARPNAGLIFDLNVFGSAIPGAVVLDWFAMALVFAAGMVALWRRRLVSPSAALLVVSLGIVALLGEGAARLHAVIFPATEGFPTYSSALWIRRYVTLNRAGYRDTEHSLARPPATHRLLLVGDSYVYGIGIRSMDGRLGEQLGRDLEQSTNVRWEIVNISHPDRNTLDEIQMLDSSVAYRPDIVILIYVFNDIDYLYRVTERSVLTEAPRSLVQIAHPVRLLYKNSFLFQELYVRFRAVTISSRGLGLPDPYADSRLLEHHVNDVAKFVAVGRTVTEVVGVAPVELRITDDTAAARRYRAFVGAGVRQGLPIWPTDDVFRGRGIRELSVSRLDGHPNELANALLARALADRVVTLCCVHATAKRARSGS
ncbi:MAG TPA: hypothetical protein VLT79_07535 [Gemmatimonadales bacterium]|nr:hypothetical protein [Gemmatimonadales bacterium]